VSVRAQPLSASQGHGLPSSELTFGDPSLCLLFSCTSLLQLVHLTVNQATALLQPNHHDLNTPLGADPAR
jgi:hypothetical protein